MTEAAVVIASFDDWPVLKRNLSSLCEGGSGITPIVVNHGSQGLPEAELSQRFPTVTSIRASDDLWWAGATNVGVRHALAAGFRYIMLLNSDCVIDSESVRELVRTSAAQDSIVAPIQRELGTNRVLVGRVQTAVWLGFPTLWASRRQPRGTDPVKTPMIIGGRGVVIPSRVFLSVGELAEAALPHYLSDHDFFLRCRAAGEQLLLAPTVDVFVDQSRTSIAARRNRITLSDLRRTLTDPRSHHQLAAQRAFFQRNYPVKRLWWIGFALSMSRVVLRSRVPPTRA